MAGGTGTRASTPHSAAGGYALPARRHPRSTSCSNPLGVPSRMNIAMLESIWLCRPRLWDGKSPHPSQTRKRARDRGDPKLDGTSPDGKSILYDGPHSRKIDNPVTVGSLLLKLHHLVDDKIQARSQDRTAVTQQPWASRRSRGQRSANEVLSQEAYGAPYTFSEILTVKSDDVTAALRHLRIHRQGPNVPQPEYRSPSRCW
jgi:DNA-directed RNA polymerase beta subunit